MLLPVLAALILLLPHGDALCEDTCDSFANDGVCDDGGPGADYDICPLGSDCADCGTRIAPAPSPPQSPLAAAARAACAARTKRAYSYAHTRRSRA